MLLDALAEDLVKATFFPLGRRAEHMPELFDRIATEGHEIGTHTYEHRNAAHCWPWVAVADIAAEYETLSKWVPTDGLFRPPYGKVTLATAMSIRGRGASMCTWTFDSGDTAPQPPDPDAVVFELLRAGGGVCLMHDFNWRATHDQLVLDITRRAIRAASKQGLRICTIGEILRPTTRPRLRKEQLEAKGAA